MVASKERGARGHLVTPPPAPPSTSSLVPFTGRQRGRGVRSLYSGRRGCCHPSLGLQPFCLCFNICRQPVNLGDVDVQESTSGHVWVIGASRLPNSLVSTTRCQLTTSPGNHFKTGSEGRHANHPVNRQSFPRRQISRIPHSHKSVLPSA